jgi:hypothetical protein
MKVTLNTNQGENFKSHTMQTITINWQDDNSIKKAERRKAFLENKGYTLIDTTNLLNTSILTYKI